jgi:hypothetical protein
MIYLEPRSTFDSCIIKNEPVIYCFDLLISILIEMGMEYIQAIDFYCYNIEPLIAYEGLIVQHTE